MNKRTESNHRVHVWIFNAGLIFLVLGIIVCVQGCTKAIDIHITNERSYPIIATIKLGNNADRSITLGVIAGSNSRRFDGATTEHQQRYHLEFQNSAGKKVAEIEATPKEMNEQSENDTWYVTVKK